MIYEKVNPSARLTPRSPAQKPHNKQDPCTKNRKSRPAAAVFQELKLRACMPNPPQAQGGFGITEPVMDPKPSCRRIWVEATC